MEKTRKTNRYRHVTHSITFALLLIVAGLAFLGFNLGYISTSYKDVIFSWPMLIIVFGISAFCNSNFRQGVLLLIVGGFFIVPRIANVCPGLLPVDSANFVHLYWPMLLIAAGVLFIIHRLMPSSHGYCCVSHSDNADLRNSEGFAVFEKHKGERGKGYFNEQSVFSSGKHIVLDPEFKGGEISTVLGDISLDLRKTNLPEGDTFLEVNVVLGGVKILVPSNWNVQIRMESVLFNFEDKRFEVTENDNTRRLIIIGKGVLSSGELRD